MGVKYQKVMDLFGRYKARFKLCQLCYNLLLKYRKYKINKWYNTD